MSEQTEPDLAGMAAGGMAAGGMAAGGEVTAAAADQRGERELTGHPAVDAAVGAVTGAASQAPADLIPAFQAAHRTLRETLATIDEQ